MNGISWENGDAVNHKFAHPPSVRVLSQFDVKHANNCSSLKMASRNPLVHREHGHGSNDDANKDGRVATAMNGLKFTGEGISPLVGLVKHNPLTFVRWCA